MGFARTLTSGQSCRVIVMDVATGAMRIVFVNDTVLLEAPNWTRDDRLILNGDGVLWQLPADGSADARVIPVDVPELNNDHVLAPDGDTIYLSANDGHLYAASLAGGPARRITRSAERLHFLHGVSPDGARLAYVALVPAGDDLWADANIHTVAIDGEDDLALTFDERPADGSEYSPDGRWIYFNTERYSDIPGHAQIARMRVDGSGMQQLTFDERVNWFPHLSPSGDRAVFLSYPPGTVGHPADLPVQLKLVEAGEWDAASVVVELHGGQGTINVNSWSPDGQSFAYVDYPVAGHEVSATTA